jgi:phytoene synthase
MNEELRASYAVCRRMHRRHDPTYYFATRRLPAEKRPAVHALYAFVRVADELVDGPRRAHRARARRAALDRWERELEHGMASGGSPQPVIAALVDAGKRHDLPLGELSVYMASMRVDCGRVRMESWRELEDYMQGSAAAVGRIMAPLLGAPSDHHETFARLGVAFQLTNFIRDVREDWELDRLYLPLEDRERFGVDEAQIARREATPGFRALLAFEVDRARALFDETAPAVRAVAPSVRPGMRMARAVYLRLLDRVERIGFDVLRRRAALRPWEMGRAVLPALRTGA